MAAIFLDRAGESAENPELLRRESVKFMAMW
jgi:hypothetical protein